MWRNNEENGGAAAAWHGIASAAGSVAAWQHGVNNNQ
jgi:hypothetical protein